MFHLRVCIVFHPTTLFTASTWNTKTPFSRMICGSGWTSINLCDSFPASVLDVISVLSRNFLNWRPSCYGKEDWYLISTTALLQGLAVGTLGLLEIQTISSQTDTSDLGSSCQIFMCLSLDQCSGPVVSSSKLLIEIDQSQIIFRVEEKLKPRAPQWGPSSPWVALQHGRLLIQIQYL